MYQHMPTHTAACACGHALHARAQELGAAASSIKDGVPAPDFNGGHPDPNLTYADELVKIMWGEGARAGGAGARGGAGRWGMQAGRLGLMKQ